MNLLNVENISKTYSEKILLNNVSFGINEGDKIGIIGLNGSGKSTLLKIVTGKDEFFDGLITKGKGVRVEYLEQNSEFDSNATVLQQIFKGDTREMKLLMEYEELLEKVSSNSFNEEDNNKLIKIQEKIDSGATINQAVKETVKETSTDKKIELGIKVLLANKIVRISLIVCAILFVYEIIVRWIIYKKAGRHGWAAIVPIYRQITMYKVSGLSPWLILLILIPIIGAFIIAIIEIIQKFKLSNKFGKGVLFGFGLLFLQPIFESIIAFSKKIEYKG